MRFEELQASRDQIYAIAEKYGVTNIRVFGSVVRGDADAMSDVDFMVNMREGQSVFDLVAFQGEVGNLLHRDVDVVEIEGIRNPLRRRYMLADVRPL